MKMNTITPGLFFVATPLVALLAFDAVAELSPEWVRPVPAGASLSAGMQAMVVNAAGISYITGINGPSSNTNCITAAIAPDGALLWSDEFNGAANWHDQARGIALGPDSVLYVVGNTPGPGSYARVLLLKYDAATGARLDATEYSSGPFTSEYGGSVAVDPLGDVYVGGGTVGDGADALILKFDADGQVQWVRTWDGPAFGPYSQDSVQGLTLDPDGNPVVLIHGVMNSLHPDYVVIKYDAADGNVIWETHWG
ncbi:MAG: PQQ-binding-like beta-propeller repeat protein, partial [Phycisphaerae bacterium]